MEEADQLCDRVAIIDHGSLLALDTPEQLKRSTGIDTIVTIKATGDLDGFSTALTAIEGASSVRPIEKGLELHVSTSDRLLARVVSCAEQAHVDIQDLSVTEPTLETVFIALTGKELRDA